MFKQFLLIFPSSLGLPPPKKRPYSLRQDPTPGLWEELFSRRKRKRSVRDRFDRNVLSAFSRLGEDFSAANGDRNSNHEDRLIWGFPEMAVPQNGWFTMENPNKMDDLGVQYPHVWKPHMVPWSPFTAAPQVKL